MTNIDTYVIDSVMHENPFARTLLAKDSAGNPKVIRIAKTEWTAPERPGGGTPGPRRSNSASTNCFTATKTSFEICDAPPPAVLAHQIEVLTELKRFVPESIEYSGTHEGLPYYVMEKHDGQTLSELIALGSFPLDVYLPEVFRKLSDLLADFSANGNACHGDLKPSHIIITKSGIRLLSPGWFSPSGSVTTIDYYPFLEPDDQLAFGIALFEAVCKSHPFAGSADESLERRIHPQFKHLIDTLISRGWSHMAGFLRFRTPREIRPSLSHEAESYLLRALRLSFSSDGLLMPATRMSGWAELRAGLATLDDLH